MAKKPNSSGELQEYVPAGNGDASGEYGDADGNNKHLTTFVNPHTGKSGLVKDQTKESTIKNPLTSNADKDKMLISKCRNFDELENYIASKSVVARDKETNRRSFEII